MKKVISLFLALIFAYSAVSINCFSITADQASLNQLLETEIIIEDRLKTSLSEKDRTYYKALENEILNELHNRSAGDITAKLKNNLNLIYDLKNKLELLKLDNGVLYSSIKEAKDKIKQTERIQKILENELYSRSSWPEYITKKVLFCLKDTIVGGINGATAGTIISVFLSPFLGFNSKTILRWTLNMSITNCVKSLISDFSLKFFTKSEEVNNFSKAILNLIPSIAGSVLSQKILDNNQPAN